jgi:ubiquitin carboxyl-terminal hydrolase L5
MLREFGVKGVQVQEVMSLDDEGVSYLEYESLNSFFFTGYQTHKCLSRKPIYGLIFLFRWREDDDAEKQEASCPDGIWFANQVCSEASFDHDLDQQVSRQPAIPVPVWHY